MNNKIILRLSIVLISLTALVLVIQNHSKALLINSKAFGTKSDLAVTVLFDNSLHTIKPFFVEDTGYFIIPSGIELDKCCFWYDENNISLSLDGNHLPKGQFLSGGSFDQNYCLDLKSQDNDPERFNIIFKQSENLPSIYLDTESDSLDYIHEHKDNHEKGRLKIVSEGGNILYDKNLAFIKGHGNTSWGEDKKPYQFTLEKEESILGMKHGKKWLILANRLDPSFIRNWVAFSIGAHMGMQYTPECRFVDVYMNSEYMGNYLLTSKIDIGEGRIPINDLEDEKNPDHDITGGYLIERNYGTKYEKRPQRFKTENGEKYGIRSPENATLEELEYISNVFQCAENAIYADDGIDPVTGKHFTELIDLESFVSKYMVEEFVFNESSGTTSSWFYKPEDKLSTKIYAGPLWDYDKALGIHGKYAKYDVVSKLNVYRSHDRCNLFSKLYSKFDFLQELVAQYSTKLHPALHYLIEEGALKDQVSLIRKSVEIDNIRWTPAMDFEESADYVYDWMMKRRDYLNKVWVDCEPFYLVRLVDEGGSVRDYLNIPPGGSIDGKTDDMGEGFLYWEAFTDWDDKDCERYYIGENTPVNQDLLLRPIYEEE